MRVLINSEEFYIPYELTTDVSPDTPYSVEATDEQVEKFWVVRKAFDEARQKLIEIAYEMEKE